MRDHPGGAGLLAKAAGGDESAARQLVDDIGPLVYGFVLGRVADRSAAEDIVQDVFVEALRSRNHFRGESELSTWVCAIARYRIFRWYEAERKRDRVQAAARQHAGLERRRSAETETDAVDSHDLVVRALAKVPLTQRQALSLKYLEGLTVSAIAEAMTLGPIQVQSLLQRGRESLKRHMQEAST